MHVVGCHLENLQKQSALRSLSSFICSLLVLNIGLLTKNNVQEKIQDICGVRGVVGRNDGHFTFRLRVLGTRSV